MIEIGQRGYAHRVASYPVFKQKVWGRASKEQIVHTLARSEDESIIASKGHYYIVTYYSDRAKEKLFSKRNRFLPVWMLLYAKLIILAARLAFWFEPMICDRVELIISSIFNDTARRTWVVTYGIVFISHIVSFETVTNCNEWKIIFFL